MTTELTLRRGTVERSRQILARDLRAIVNDAEGLLEEMANSTADEFSAARDKVEAKLGEARSGFDAARTAFTRQARDAADVTHEYVRENPWTTMAVAAAAGLIAAFLFSRR